MADEIEEESGTPMSPKAKLVAGVVVAVIVVLSGWLTLRVSSPAIAPGQTPPAGHYPLSCGFCHRVSADVKVVK